MTDTTIPVFHPTGALRVPSPVEMDRTTGSAPERRSAPAGRSRLRRTLSSLLRLVDEAPFDLSWPPARRPFESRVAGRLARAGASQATGRQLPTEGASNTARPEGQESPMRRTSFAATIAATALLLGAPASPLAAQPASAPRHVRPIVRPASLAANPAVRTVAAYRFLAPRAAGLPIEIVLADSAGRVVGSYRTEGSPAPLPLQVTVLETDIVLQAQTGEGLLTLRLLGQNDPTVRDVVGQWWLGARSGELRGRVVR